MNIGSGLEAGPDGRQRRPGHPGGRRCGAGSTNRRPAAPRTTGRWRGFQSARRARARAAVRPGGRLDAGGGHRAGEEVALAELAAEAGSRSSWSGCSIPSATMRSRGSGRGPRSSGRTPSPRVALVGRDELLGDLEHVHPEPAQVAERGVAGAEVVDRDPGAERAQRVEAGDGRRASWNMTVSVISRTRSRGIEAASPRGPPEVVDEAGLLELRAAG